jgi:hypothetical protein
VDEVYLQGLGCPPLHTCIACSTDHLHVLCAAGACDVDAVDVWGAGLPSTAHMHKDVGKRTRTKKRRKTRTYYTRIFGLGQKPAYNERE